MKPGEVYRHVRTGNPYVVIAVGKHTETQEMLVVYRRQDMDDGSWTSPWIRPLDMFTQRFQKVAQ